jgi:DNA-binding MarR family transcriptional regulator
MNKDAENASVSEYQLHEFKRLMSKFVQCCHERTSYQAERFDLPEAEQRCLMQFGVDRYVTAKGLAGAMNVAKSRITRIVDSLVKKGYVQRTPDPEDSRVVLLSLTPRGKSLRDEIEEFLLDIHRVTLDGMSSQQRNQLIEALTNLSSRMQAAKDMME